MSGLREKQKATRKSRILEAAVTLFRANGYRSARIETIAQMAGISVGTFYNYYQTKGDVLIAVVALEVEEVLEAGAAIVANPPEGIEQALLTLIFSYYDHSLNYLSKEMWRTAMAHSIEAPGTRNGQLYNALDRQLAAQVGALITALQARGEVCQTVRVAAMGLVIFNNLNQNFVDFVKDEGMGLEVLRGRVADQTRPLAEFMQPGR